MAGDERFVGAWELVKTERRDAGGAVVGEALPGYTGQIMYTADGHMSANLMGAGRPVLDSADRQTWTDEQKVRAFETYIGYYGTYTVDDQTGVVTHHVHGSSSPAMTGSDQPRHFRLTGDELVLSPPLREGSTERSFIIWRRSTASPAG
jgi:hypothetical protein